MRWRSWCKTRDEETRLRRLESHRSLRVSSPWTRLPAIVAVALVLATCAAAADGVKPTLVEVWCVGDDGLTLGLRDALENAFKSSSDFQLSSGKKPGTLVVTIPTNVVWKQAKQADKRTKVLYRVEFASADDKTISKSTGSCWDDALTKCAAQIVKDARIVVRKFGTAKIRPRTQL
jgi:hypothetical protein